MLGSCLDHLRRQTAPYQVIVADNASTDGTVDFLRAEYSEVQIVELSENLGFGAGNNRGVAAWHGAVRRADQQRRRCRAGLP